MTYSEIIKKVVDRIIEVNPANDKISTQNKAVYESAVNYFGEDNVEIQKIIDRKLLENVLDDFSTRGFLNTFDFCLPEDWDFDDYGWLEYYVTHQNQFAKFLESITSENIQNSNLWLQTIVIKFSNFIVSNEKKEETFINEMFVAIPLNYKGHACNGIFWLRSKTSFLHFQANYQHSHLPSSRQYKWKHPCLGTGPIVMTLESLRDNPQIFLWDLFWLELDKCIRVESLEGGPYIHMKHIVLSTTHSDYKLEEFNLNDIKGHMFNPKHKVFQKFIKNVIHKLLISQKLQYHFRRNQIIVTNSFVELVLLISNTAIEEIKENFESTYNDIISPFNRDFRSNFFIKACIYKNSFITNINDYNETLFTDLDLGFTFKKEKIHLQIVDNPNNESFPIYYILNKGILSYIAYQLLIYINNYYARHQSSQIGSNKK